MTTFTPHPYQVAARQFALQRLLAEAKKGAALFLEPGLGKTAVTLDTIDALKKVTGLGKVLIVGPIRVIHHVWPKEIAKWDFDLTHSIVHGTPLQRLKALEQDVDIYLTNPQSMQWLIKQKLPRFEMLVVDESTAFKNWTAKQTKAIRKLAPLVRKSLILTGTPTSNSYENIFPQMFLVDDGETLGKTITGFRQKYMQRGGYENRQWIMRKDMIEPLKAAVAPQCLYMDAVSNLDMPDLIHNVIDVELPKKVAKAYKKLETDLYLELETVDPDVFEYAIGGRAILAGKSVKALANSAGHKYTLCRQVANGGAYNENGEAEHVHDAKVDALEDLYSELNGKQLLVAYQFKHDLERLRKRFDERMWYLDGKETRSTTGSKFLSIVLEKWKKKEIGMLAVQCQSFSHGIDGLQEGCNDIAWFGLTDQPEVHHQFNCRIYRQGSSGGQVRIHYLVTKGTLDRLILRRLRDKAESQKSLLESLRGFRNG